MYVQSPWTQDSCLPLRIDDLGVIAAVIECESFVTKFNADDNQTSVFSSIRFVMRHTNMLLVVWSYLYSPQVHSSALDSPVPVVTTWADAGQSR